MKKANIISFLTLYIIVIAFAGSMYISSCNNGEKTEEELKHKQDSASKAKEDSAAAAFEKEMEQASKDSALAAQEKTPR